MAKWKRHSKMDNVNSERCGGSGGLYNLIDGKYQSQPVLCEHFTPSRSATQPQLPC